MKKSEIVLGHTYTNGKGRIRKVIAEGAEYRCSDFALDYDCIRYEVVDDGTKKNRTAGQQFNMTRRAFAQWAKTDYGKGF